MHFSPITFYDKHYTRAYSASQLPQSLVNRILFRFFINLAHDALAGFEFAGNVFYVSVSDWIISASIGVRTADNAVRILLISHDTLGR